MSKRTNMSYIYIDGEKFKELLESASGKTLKQISLENGFSDSFLRMVVKTGKASPSAQAVARLYGIEPSAYKDKPVEDPKRVVDEDDLKQITFDDLITEDARQALKTIVKSAVAEALHEYFKNGAIVITPDKGATYKLPNEPIKPADFLRDLDDERKEDDKRKFDERFEI